MANDEDDFLDLNSGDDVADPRLKTGGLIIACRDCPTPVFNATFGGKVEIIPSIFEDDAGELANFRDFPALAAKLGRFPTLAEAETYQAELIAAENARRAPAIAAGWDAYDLAELAKQNPNRAGGNSGRGECTSEGNLTTVRPSLGVAGLRNGR